MELIGPCLRFQLVTRTHHNVILYVHCPYAFVYETTGKIQKPNNIKVDKVSDLSFRFTVVVVGRTIIFQSMDTHFRAWVGNSWPAGLSGSTWLSNRPAATHLIFNKTYSNDRDMCFYAFLQHRTKWNVINNEVQIISRKAVLLKFVLFYGV